jgi:basic amino acid/polyamine antiporter, APA family
MSVSFPHTTLARSEPAREPGLRPALRFRDVVGLTVGTVVGVGIFRTPSMVAEHAGSTGLVLLAWLAGGLLSLIGALCYAEMASAYPSTGGDYHYLTRAFGRRVGFLFAWARLSVVQTGAIALLAFVLGDYAAQLVPLDGVLGPLGAWASPLYAGLTVIVLTATNLAGVRHGAATQNVLTSIEIGGILLVIVAGLLAAPVEAPRMAAVAPPTAALGLVMVFVLLTYGGWSEAAYLSGEVRDPGRTMVRALVTSLVLITGLYLLVNWTFLAALGVSGVAASKAVATDVAHRALGDPGARLIGLLVVISSLTSANAAIFTGARTCHALGRDFSAFAVVGRWRSTSGTPANALMAQAAVALALVGVGGITRRGFETMVEYTAPVFWLFLFLTGIGLIVLRWRDPARPRPFRVPLYPLTPLVFCASSGYLVYASLAYAGPGALVGASVLALGLVLLALTGGRPVRPVASPHSEGGS